MRRVRSSHRFLRSGEVGLSHQADAMVPKARDAILTPGLPAVPFDIVSVPSMSTGAPVCPTTIAGARLPSVTKSVTDRPESPGTTRYDASIATRSKRERPCTRACARRRRTLLVTHLGCGPSTERVDACFCRETITIMVQAHRDRHCGPDGRCIGEEERFDGVLHRRGLTGGGACAADSEVVGEGTPDQTPQDGPGLQGIHGARRKAAARDQTAQEGRGPELRGDTQAARRRSRDDQPQRFGVRRIRPGPRGSGCGGSGSGLTRR